MSRLHSIGQLGGAPFGELVNISTASTAVTLDDTAIGVLNVWNGNAGPARVFLPQAERGMIIDVLITVDAVSSATLFGPSSGNSGAQDIYTINGDESTGGFVQCQTSAEGGMWIRFVGISPLRWLALGMNSTVGLVSTSTGA